MKKILNINPITSKEFNIMSQDYLDSIKSKNTEVISISIERGPASIEAFYDEAYALPEILNIVDEYKSKVDAIMLNCFADPALYAARELANIPIVGPGETCIYTALMLGNKFAAISTRENSGPWVEIQARQYGVEDRLVASIGIDISVLELGSDLEKTAECLIEEANILIQQKGAEVIVLGCTGMATVINLVQRKLSVPVIEPMAATFKMAEMLCSLDLKHSKACLYMYPDRGKITGY